MTQTQTATYTIEAFIEDVRYVFKNESDPHVQAKTVSKYLEKLLAVPGWLEEKLELEEEGGFGRHSLHLDEESGHPGNGWWLMTSVQKPGQDNLPHDHGVTWVVYGEGVHPPAQVALGLPRGGCGPCRDRGAWQLRSEGRLRGLLPARGDPRHTERRRGALIGGAP